MRRVGRDGSLLGMIGMVMGQRRRRHFGFLVGLSVTIGMVGSGFLPAEAQRQGEAINPVSFDLTNLSGKWAVGTIRGCSTYPYSVSTANNVIRFINPAGGVDEERIVSREGASWRTETVRSPSNPIGAQWDYRPSGASRISVYDRTKGKSFEILKCPSDSETLAQIGSLPTSAPNVLELQRSQPTDRVTSDGKIIQTVVAEGLGSTVESAIHNAAENALKQVVGTFIDTETLIVRRTQISDGIRNEARSINARTREYSQGSIYKFDVIETRQDAGLFRISAKVSVRVEDFKAYIAKPSESSARIGAEVFAQQSIQTQNASNARQILIEKIIIPIIKGEASAVSINNPILYSEFVKRHPTRALQDVPSSSNMVVFDAVVELNPNFSENIKKTLESIAVHKERLESPAISGNDYPVGYFGLRYDSIGRAMSAKIRQEGKFDSERDTLIFFDTGNNKNIGAWGSGGIWDVYVLRDVKIRTERGPLAGASNLSDAIAQGLDGAAANFIMHSRGIRFAQLDVSIKEPGGEIKNEFIVKSNEQSWSLKTMHGYINTSSDGRLTVNSGWSNIGASGPLRDVTYFIISAKRKFNIFLKLGDGDIGANDSITVKLILN